MYLIVYGAMFLLIILLLPQGIIPTLQKYWSKIRSARAKSQKEAMLVVENGKKEKA
jgi:hypothetical protein